MAASSALKMTAACSVLVILLSAASQPAMAVLPAAPVTLLGGITYLFDPVTGNLFFFAPERQCTKDRSLCNHACYLGCSAFAEHVVCNRIICENAGSCLTGFTAGCASACTTACSVIPDN